MGVELGKVLAKNILSQLDKPADVTGHDSSVCGTFGVLEPALGCTAGRLSHMLTHII